MNTAMERKLTSLIKVEKKLSKDLYFGRRQPYSYDDVVKPTRRLCTLYFTRKCVHLSLVFLCVLLSLNSIIHFNYILVFIVKLIKS